MPSDLFPEARIDRGDQGGILRETFPIKVQKRLELPLDRVGIAMGREIDPVSFGEPVRIILVVPLGARATVMEVIEPGAASRGVGKRTHRLFLQIDSPLRPEASAGGAG